MTDFLGQQLVGCTWQQGQGGFQAFDPKNNDYLELTFSFATSNQIQAALTLAKQASLAFSQTRLKARAKFLNHCAEQLGLIKTPLIERVMAETGYSIERVTSEFDRTYHQFHYFAELLLSGQHLNIRINIPQQQFLHQSQQLNQGYANYAEASADLRYINQALGPVVVFGASNFPLAYSVAGGDVVAALAAGCPVIVKGHNAHPGTSQLVAEAIRKAVVASQMPLGVFSLLFGEGNELGKKLVVASEIKAVAFTGSLAGGKALLKLANERAEPIPVFAEMGSVNPVVFLPNSLMQNHQQLAEQFFASFSLSAGQYCVSPGLVIAIENENLALFIQALTGLVKRQQAQSMLSQSICQQYQKGVKLFEDLPEVEVLARGLDVTGDKSCFSQIQFFKTSAKNFINQHKLHEEIFGHAALIVTCRNIDELTQVVSNLAGQLTASLHGTETELSNNYDIFRLLTHKVGRVIINGFPTGVEVCDAMMHGGPFPASTDSRFTSVGSSSIARFMRPVCFQNTPESLLPDELKNENPNQLTRLVNGEYTNKAIMTN